MPDFVFLDDQGKEFLVKLWGGEPWIFYRHPDGQWVSLRKVGSGELPSLRSRLYYSFKVSCSAGIPGSGR